MSDAAGNVSFSATYNLNSPHDRFAGRSRERHAAQAGRSVPLDKRVYEIPACSLTTTILRCPTISRKFSGPTHSYVMELPPPAGELRLVSVPESGTFACSRLLSPALPACGGAGQRLYEPSKAPLRDDTRVQTCLRAACIRASMRRQPKEGRRGPTLYLFTDAARPGTGLPCKDRKARGCFPSCRP